MLTLKLISQLATILCAIFNYRLWQGVSPSILWKGKIILSNPAVPSKLQLFELPVWKLNKFSQGCTTCYRLIPRNTSGQWAENEVWKLVSDIMKQATSLILPVTSAEHSLLSEQHVVPNVNSAVPSARAPPNLLNSSSSRQLESAEGTRQRRRSRWRLRGAIHNLLFSRRENKMCIFIYMPIGRWSDAFQVTVMPLCMLHIKCAHRHIRGFFS